MNQKHWHRRIIDRKKDTKVIDKRCSLDFIHDAALPSCPLYTFYLGDYMNKTTLVLLSSLTIFSLTTTPEQDALTQAVNSVLANTAQYIAEATITPTDDEALSASTIRTGLAIHASCNTTLATLNNPTTIEPVGQSFVAPLINDIILSKQSLTTKIKTILTNAINILAPQVNAFVSAPTTRAEGTNLETQLTTLINATKTNYTELSALTTPSPDQLTQKRDLNKHIGSLINTRSTLLKSYNRIPIPSL